MLEKKYKVAMAVMAVVEGMLNAYDHKDVLMLAECYDNGREQGFCIKNMDDKYPWRVATFAENRNSDDIVVYECKGGSIRNIPSEDEYKSAKYFKYDEYYKAADHIVEYLTKKA